MSKDDSPPNPTMTISLPQTMVIAIVTALLASVGTSGSLTMLSDGDDLHREVSSIKADIERMNDKLDDVYEIVDRAHPRTGVVP